MKIEPSLFVNGRLCVGWMVDVTDDAA